MSDRMPEDLPVTKRINVMVGMTRSKVFFFLFVRCLWMTTRFEVVAGSRLKDWPGHKPSRAPSLEVHLARRQTYQGASFSSSIATHSNPLLGAGFKVGFFKGS